MSVGDAVDVVGNMDGNDMASLVCVPLGNIVLVLLVDVMVVIDYE